MSVDPVTTVGQTTLGVLDPRKAREKEKWWPGTVVAYVPETGEMQVDLGEFGGIVWMQNSNNRPFRVGQRVFANFTPESSGAFVQSGVFADEPMASVYQTAQQFFPALTPTPMVFHAVQSNEWGMWDGGARLNIPQSGRYSLSAGAQFGSAFSDARINLELWINGSAIADAAGGLDSMARDVNRSADREIWIAAGSYVEARVYLDEVSGSGGPFFTTPSGTVCHLSAKWTTP
jgi:hypothetical protein